MSRKRPFSYEEFKQVYSKVPRLCVDLIIQDPKGQVLLLRREEEPSVGMWHLPGGTVLFREEVEQAIKRIAQEEVGVAVRVEGLVGFIEFLNEERGNQAFHSLSLAVVCSIQEKISRTPKRQFFKVVPENTIKEQGLFLEKILSGRWKDAACDDPNCTDEDCLKDSAA
ncbi:hypothetical protein A2631_06040 [Candidatus Daviesbacteria bacterium RIFCSPHIGHO2_01_FULL_44_29]|uniref:Nudix hydrolase domain-containing protein n=1 Tax=Candidatus Daviesbacteria bacterium RIFCSPHIGHO2_02_FULL_43_12 TaxID=1797776 RepID=A0A1F5KJ43_9BACT|nr:MAG: hypothetical protein A2631_06040 [Candidatus Daviesbacteria bacterium RIFCSPHIGHO2_01_FULL_44_29]OGE39153.1 MAG: hypothetical protein A3E86_03370 [Candidatus Daviesbacteria bacterium RIFCSPHIGHO2_12_FULL_47_45]OGE40956.1 MAG: hypothetical protein A3D25_02870 [Candidatus Daviesbacteria bacterium RIFCSPHIGHO2_02_FULL_43_12]OGE69893.1 MAG: hypothetical protein A3B55_05800 [Candidatus Daviesbacteria bacterium RIFCSPLOWO2_01_FULL_43_15]